jgi:hypothetical protein
MVDDNSWPVILLYRTKIYWWYLLQVIGIACCVITVGLKALKADR